MKSPCKHCPFRRDVKPFLHPQRAAQIAIAALNPYNEFPCHKTTVSDEEFWGNGSHMVTTEDSKECAGYVSLRISEGVIDAPIGFSMPNNVYEDCDEMIDAYEDEFNNR